jgi:hypothetical protein
MEYDKYIIFSLTDWDVYQIAIRFISRKRFDYEI